MTIVTRIGKEIVSGTDINSRKSCAGSGTGPHDNAIFLLHALTAIMYNLIFRAGGRDAKGPKEMEYGIERCPKRFRFPQPIYTIRMK